MFFSREPVLEMIVYARDGYDLVLFPINGAGTVYKTPACEIIHIGTETFIRAGSVQEDFVLPALKYGIREVAQCNEGSPITPGECGKINNATLTNSGNISNSTDTMNILDNGHTAPQAEDRPDESKRRKFLKYKSFRKSKPNRKEHKAEDRAGYVDGSDVNDVEKNTQGQQKNSMIEGQNVLDDKHN